LFFGPAIVAWTKKERSMLFWDGKKKMEKGKRGNT
jgi:hypothetical protein